MKMKILRRCMAMLLCVWVCALSVKADGTTDTSAQDAATQAAAETEADLTAASEVYDALSGEASAARARTVDTYDTADMTDDGEQMIDYESGISAASNTNTVRTRAQETSAKSTSDPMRVPIVIDGEISDISAYLFADGVSYLSLRESAALLFPGAKIGWNVARGVATISHEKVELSAAWGQPYIEANGRYFALSGLYPAENLLVRGVTYVPLRNIARAAGAAIEWNAKNRCAELVTGRSTLLSGDDFYNANDVYWLSKIIYAESGDQSLRGQLAVGAVIRNRQAHPAYPDSVYGVIFDRNHGVQFSPTADGAINKTPSQKSIIAAKLVLDGCMISYDALYFLDPSMATSFWIVENCDFLFTIGCHDFYI